MFGGRGKLKDLDDFKKRWAKTEDDPKGEFFSQTIYETTAMKQL